MIENRFDHLLVTVDHLQYALGAARIDHQFSKADRHRRRALAGFEDEGVACGYGGAEHPHRDHCRKIERRDPGADPDRLAHREYVDSRSGTLRIFTLEKMRNATGKFDDLQPALDISLGIRNCLAVLAGQKPGQIIHVALEKVTEAGQDACAALRVCHRPQGLCLSRDRDRPVEFLPSGETDACLHFACRRIEDINKIFGGRVFAARDKMTDLPHVLFSS